MEMEGELSFMVAVVGLGPIGSAACRHLSALYPSPSFPPLGVVGIGSPEPEPGVDWRCSLPDSVFSSHYDNGRITRVVDPDPTWSKLAADSIARYPRLQQESGIAFHGATGCLRVAPSPSPSLAKAFEVGCSFGAVSEMLGAERLRTEFPILRFGPDHSADIEAVMEHAPAGYIDPRSMVRAQLALAEKNGAKIVHETVVEIAVPEHTTDGNVSIFTNRGTTIRARKVLICAGAYSGFLIPPNVLRKRRLDLCIKPRTVLLAEVAKSSDLLRLRDMPCFIWDKPSVLRSVVRSVYACPPLLYPDGKIYVKFGLEMLNCSQFDSPEEINEWFRGHGDPQERSALESLLKHIMPNFAFNSVHFKPCVCTYTPHGHPYIDAIDGKPIQDAALFVATGGNGASAKSSDELGCLAATLVKDGKWPSKDLSASIFRAVFVSPPREDKNPNHT